MTVPLEVVNVSKLFREMKVGDRQLFGRSFNLRSLNSMKRSANNRLGRDIVIAEVPEGYLAWRKK